MISFYSSDHARRSRAAARVSLISALCLVAAAWAVCAFLCAGVRTANAGLMFRRVLILSTLSGWGAILLWTLIYRPARAAYRHEESLLNEDAMPYEGALTVEKDAFQIPRGIRVCRARLDTAEGPVSLRVAAGFARRLPQGEPIRVQTVRQYIVGYEVLHEEA